MRQCHGMAMSALMDVLLAAKKYIYILLEDFNFDILKQSEHLLGKNTLFKLTQLLYKNR